MGGRGRIGSRENGIQGGRGRMVGRVARKDVKKGEFISCYY